MSEAGDFPLPAPGESRELLIPGPAGHLEALIALPRGEGLPKAFCVVCHPHPLFGGAMTNKVAYTLASCALKAGMAAARFNFRGVGRSTGLHDDGRGEVEDAIAVVEWMRKALPGADCALAGFSFGAHVSLKAAERVHPKFLVSISPPFGRYMKDDRHPAQPQCPWLVVHSTDDDTVSYEETRTALETYEHPPRLVTFEGAGHFYHGRLTDLSNVVLPFMQQELS